MMAGGRTNEVFEFTEPPRRRSVHVDWVDDDEDTEVEDEDEGMAELKRYQKLLSND